MTAARSDDSAAPSGVSRRAFLGAGIGALVAFTLERNGAHLFERAAGAATPGGLPTGVPSAPTAQAITSAPVTGWITVNSDNTVTIAFGGAEMGQGISTGLAQAAAEELMVDWAQVRTTFAPTSQSYVTGGSWGIRRNFQSMRVAGAQARDMLVQAAANQWGITPAQCTAAQGVVTNTVTKATLTYAQLVGAAATLPVPSSPALTDPAKFRIAGTSAIRTDLAAKVNGSAQFGIDVRVPGMVFAAIKHCPTIGGTLVGTPSTPAGALSVVPLGNAAAVVATNTWAALNGAANLAASWTTPAGASQMSSSAILAQAQSLMATGTPGSPLAEQIGDAPGAYATAPKQMEATYQLPYLAHVMMEVPNCTVSLTGSSAEVWAPTQAPGWVVSTVSGITGLPAAAITVRPTFLGGGLGRKIEQDFVAQAVKVAQAVGKPVQLVWSREEDLGHDQYRPMGLVRVRLGLDDTGAVTAYQSRIVTPSPLYQRSWIGPNGNDNVDGAVGLPYAFPTRLVEYVRHPVAVPVGFWRSVGESINVFTTESAIDEAALLTNQDPLAFRQRLLAGNSRVLAVLNAAASMIGWSSAAPAGSARGLAISTGFGSIAALAVEVTQPVAGTMAVTRACCAIDCGFAVNPNQVEAQLQGAILQGISSALWGQTTFSNGQASSRNFSNTRLVRMSETPQFQVQIINSGLGNLGGVGEVGVPLAAPALANAWAKLTGTRVRNLPFFPAASSMGG